MAKTAAGLFYQPHFISNSEREPLVQYLCDLHPLWEMRFSPNNPPPPGKEQRPLLRPVYWLGNWQFACLGYYHPPQRIHHRSVFAEPYPALLRTIVSRIENFVQMNCRSTDIPRGWHLNTCLINYYGSRKEGPRWIDAARVGEHKDFEPGPIASVSFGERALFQFVRSAHRQAQSSVVVQQWLEDCSLQVFAGDRWKNQVFHRVQRVEKKLPKPFSTKAENFITRRLNLTFRYVPDAHICEWGELPALLREDTQGYVRQLGQHAEFWRQQDRRT